MISIIIPTYNRLNFLKEAIDSCLEQSYKDIEIIIVDDGSSDGTENYVNDLLKTEWFGKPILYFKQQNAGASAARNFGLEKAKGDFIQFLDSDDKLYPNKLQLQIERIERENADVCSCLGYMGVMYGGVDNEVIGEAFESKIDLMHKMCSGRVHVMCTPSPLWRKFVLDREKGWDTTIAFGDDLEYHIRLLTNVSNICFIPEKLFFVREHSNFRLSDAGGNFKQIESGIKTQQLIFKMLNESKLWDAIFQNGMLSNLRTLYANTLSLASNGRVKQLETFMIEVATNPKINYQILLLLIFKKIFGKKTLLKIHSLLKSK